jgi:hypothetical protein
MLLQQASPVRPQQHRGAYPRIAVAPNVTFAPWLRISRPLLALEADTVSSTGSPCERAAR